MIFKHNHLPNRLDEYIVDLYSAWLANRGVGYWCN